MPQLPANKGVVKDEKSIALLNVNKELAIKEDSILSAYVKISKSDYSKSELGFWYKIDTKSEGELISKQEECEFTYTMSDLSGNILEKDRIKILFGKKQTITGLEEGLKLLKVGETATFVIPWYLAYGMKGKAGIVKPYTSVVYNITTEK